MGLDFIKVMFFVFSIKQLIELKTILKNEIQIHPRYLYLFKKKDSLKYFIYIIFFIVYIFYMIDHQNFKDCVI